MLHPKQGPHKKTGHNHFRSTGRSHHRETGQPQAKVRHMKPVAGKGEQGDAQGSAISERVRAEAFRLVATVKEQEDRIAQRWLHGYSQSAVPLPQPNHHSFRCGS